MKNLIAVGLFLLMLVPAYAQLDSIAVKINDSAYFEDQFYVGVLYNVLIDQPSGIGQSKLSYGVQGGFIKDIPFNRSRTLAFGAGIGLSYQSISTELRARILSNDQIIYNPVAPGLTYRRNTLSFPSVEFPLEFRWRGSTPVKYRFWRVHAGFKFSYPLEVRSSFVTSEIKESFVNDDLNNWLYGTYLTFGYNTWNFYIYYQLNRLFRDGVVTAAGEAVNSRSLQLGLMFYIL